MTRIARVQLPDGKVAKFEVADDATPDEVTAATDQFLKTSQPNTTYAPSVFDKTPLPSPGSLAPPPAPSTSGIVAGATGLSNGITAGLTDRIGAILGAAVPNPAGTSIWQGPNGLRSPVDAYNLTRQQLQGYEGDLQSDHPVANTLGEVAGSVVSPLAKLVPGGGIARTMVNNGLYGAIYGGATDNSDPNAGSATGAASGVLGGAATHGLSKLVSPAVNPIVSRLQAAGIPLTLGQIAGGTVKRVEDALTSIPILGDAIIAARRQGMNQYSRAEVQQALTPIGETLPDSVATGHDAIAHAQTKLGDAYDALAPQLSAQSDPQFGKDILGIRTAAQDSGLAPAQVGQLDQILQGKVYRYFDPSTGQMSGDNLVKAQSEIKRLAANYSGSTDGSQRELGQALGAVNDALDDAATRSSPADAIARRDAINQGYSHLTRVEVAGQNALKDGIFSPMQMLRAARQGDTSIRNRVTARGGAIGQGLASDAASVLPSSVPDSGTFGRAAVGGALGAVGGGGAVLGHPAPLLIAAALTAPYLPGGRQAAQWALTGRQGAAFKGARRVIGSLAAPVAAALPILTQGGQ